MQGGDTDTWTQPMTTLKFTEKMDLEVNAVFIHSMPIRGCIKAGRKQKTICPRAEKQANTKKVVMPQK